MRKVLVLACILLIASFASATVVTLTFEGLQDNEAIMNYYNGGTGGNGSGPGPNYGITFGSDSLALIDADNGGSGNFANEPTPDTIAYFLNGPGVIMNVAGGFDTGFSFWYTANGAGSVTVYDGLDGTGNVLGTLALTSNWMDGNCTGDPTGQYCHWDPIGVTFAGTAMSVNFSGAANGIGFDNITLGSGTPTPGPEPGTLMLLGTGGLAMLLRRRR